MDLRNIFENLEKMGKEMESLFGGDVFILNGPGMFERPNLRPREMMLKNPKMFQNALPKSGQNSVNDSPIYNPNGFRDNNSGFSNFFSSSSMESQTITLNPDGSETIISKVTKNGKTTEKEIIRKGGRIVSEREVISAPGGG